MKSKDKQRKDHPKRPSSTPVQVLESPRRKLNRKNIATPETGREEQSPSYAEITKMKFPDHPVQIVSDEETLEPEQFRSIVAQYKDQNPNLDYFTDDEDAAPYDHSIWKMKVFPTKPPSGSESSDSEPGEDKHQLTQTI